MSGGAPYNAPLLRPHANPLRPDPMSETFTGLIAEAESIGADARAEFGGLTRAQLNWKPSAERWSVAQCLDHLIRIDSSYDAAFRAIESGTYRTPLARRIPLLPTFWTKMILPAVQPQAQRRFKTSKGAQPASSELGHDIVERFVRHQRDVAGHMRDIAARGAGSTIIGSPIAPLASYTVLDAFRIMVAHSRRHLLQARRVTEEPGFPK